MANQLLPYSPTGRCIYCGSDGDGKPLTDEHVVPFSLGGRDILPQASCLICQKTTQSLEAYMGRKLLIQVRTEKNMPTRRPKERPKSFPAIVVTEDGEQIIEIPVSRSLSSFSLPTFAPPGILVGRSRYDIRPVSTVNTWRPELPERTVNQLIEMKAKKIKEVPIYVDFKIIERFLAKVGHCIAVKVFGLHGFDPFLKDIICFGALDAPFFIGSLQTLYQPTNVLAEYQICIYKWLGQGLVVVRFNMLNSTIFGSGCKIGTPHYLIVVGRIRGITKYNGEFLGLGYDSIDTLTKKLM